MSKFCNISSDPNVNEKTFNLFVIHSQCNRIISKTVFNGRHPHLQEKKIGNDVLKKNLPKPITDNENNEFDILRYFHPLYGWKSICFSMICLWLRNSNDSLQRIMKKQGMSPVKLKAVFTTAIPDIFREGYSQTPDKINQIVSHGFKKLLPTITVNLKI